MFGKKEKEVKIEIEEGYKITTIPTEFYGGQNPVIKFKNVEKSIGAEPVRKELSLKPSTNKEVPKSVHLFSNRFFLFSASGVLLLLFGAGAGFYYWKLAQKNQGSQIGPPPKIDIQKPTDQIPVVMPTSTSSTASPTTTPDKPVVIEPKIEYPSVLLRKGEDMDSDGMTDSEEELFGSDPGKPDTDVDGYDDFTEIYNLYSPIDFAPGRLSKTNKVLDYVNPMFSYKVYYPSSWAVGNVDQLYRDVLFSNISGDNIEIRVFDRSPNETFEDWFAREAPGERIGALMNFITVFKSNGLSRTDNLVYYFNDPTHFYVLVYHTTNSDNVNFKNVALMMARSFRFNNVDETLPEQKIIITPTIGQ